MLFFVNRRRVNTFGGKTAVIGDIFEIVIFMLFFVNCRRVNTFGGKTAVIGDEGTMLQRRSKT